MSETVMDDEVLRDYLAEAKEHLATIEVDLLAMEQAGADIDEVLVNRVFRAAHSIKGGAGFFDLTTIRELAHKIENTLDSIRSRRIVPNPDIVSVLLLAFDKLRELIQSHHESNTANITDFVQALTRLTTDPASEQKQAPHEQVKPTLDQGKIQLGSLDLAQHRKGGKIVYLIQYDLIVDLQGKTPLEMLKSLSDYGVILEAAFDLDSAGTLDDQPSNRLVHEVLYATVLGPDMIGHVLDAPFERVWLIETNGNRNVLAASIAKPQPEPEAPQPATPTASVVNRRPAPEAQVSPAEGTIRLNVSLLDSLMTLAGELVLSRNQLTESLARGNARGIRNSAQRVSLVTSELQEVMSLTRMQPVTGLFGKFPRLVRDLCRELGKEAQLLLEGSDVEIDKTILEGLSDPLTHMVRNAVDHGIESPADRVAAGKPAMGTVKLSASHRAGQVVIEISDDGKGLAVDKVVSSALAKGLVTGEQLKGMTGGEKMALVFLPGVSTAKKVSDVSGRGVGMDVVKTNLDKLGGKMEIDSEPGKGSRFRIKLPLTLAIIPSLLVSDGGERFAIPQASVGELIRISPRHLAERIDRVGDAQVLILRDRLLPLVYLADALGAPRTTDSSKAMNVVLVNTGTFEYGLAVEELHDTVETVVKPLGRHLKGIPEYAGATILGDGRVAVILDVAALSTRAGLSLNAAANISRNREEAETAVKGEMHSLLLFHNAPSETCAVPMEQVTRVERVRPAQVELIGGRRTMQYRGANLPLVTLGDAARVGELSQNQAWVVIVFERMGKPLGLLAAEPLDKVETMVELDTVTLRQTGVAGSAVLKGRTILMLDVFELASLCRPGEATAANCAVPADASAETPTVLLAEDSEFFRGQLQRLIEALGCRVLVAEDGEAAWELLNHHVGEVAMVATDVEMPRLDGLALTRRIRSDPRFAGLTVVALSSLAGEEEITRGLEAGVDEYQIKLDKDRFQESIRAAVMKAAKALAQQ